MIGYDTKPEPLYTKTGLGYVLMISGLICILVGCLRLALEEDQKNSIARIESDLIYSRNYIYHNRYNKESARKIKEMQHMIDGIAISTATLDMSFIRSITSTGTIIVKPCHFMITNFPSDRGGYDCPDKKEKSQ